MNSCATIKTKPKELETCLYTGTCADGIMNGDEKGIDCGGSCSASCTKPNKVPRIRIKAEQIKAEILDDYVLKVEIDNLDESDINDVYVVVNKWSDGTQHIESIPVGDVKKTEFKLLMPGNPYEDSLDVQVKQADSIIASQSIPVSLSVPAYGIKLNHDALSGKLYGAVIVDNRDKPGRELQADITINKGKETYFLESGNKYSVEDNQIYHSIDYLPLSNLPPGKYEINAKFYDQSKELAEATSFVVIESGRKAFNIAPFIYFLLLIIVIVSAIIFLRIGRGD
jgi:hypothetical protein